MVSIPEIISEKDLKFTFTYVASNTWGVSWTEDVDKIGKLGEVTITNGMPNVNYADSEECDVGERTKSILTDFNSYITKSIEYILANPITNKSVLSAPISEESAAVLKEMYRKLVAAIYYKYCTMDEVSDVTVDRAKKLTIRCLEWLDSTDFYYAPGSTVYHDAEPCGLLRHSLRVVNKMTELIKIPTFSMINPCDAYLVALVHDWCKINFYEQYMRNVKNEETGVWEKVPSYRCNGSNLPFGHGVTSMFMAQKFFKLTTEQALAIRWHMGRWNTAEKELVDLCNAEETYPMIHLLQFADQLAAAKY